MENLLKRRLLHFATHFKIRNLILWPWFVSFCIQNEIMFQTHITELDLFGTTNVDCLWPTFTLFYSFLIGNKNTLFKGAMSRPAHVQDFCLLCWFSQLSAIFDFGNQADFWHQTSVYNTFTVQFLLVYLIIFFVKIYCGYRRETMISDEATESVAVSFRRCR